MPPRPAGTDGADHSYREVIVQRYQQMADFKDAVQKLLGLHTLFIFLRVIWSFTVFQVGGRPLPMYVQGMIAGEVLVHVVLRAAKLGQRQESLRLLKTYNVVQSLLTACQVLSAWMHHQGTHTDGVPQYLDAKVVAVYLSSHYPKFVPVSVLDYCKAWELFIDMVAGVFLLMCTYISHKMIVEKMKMKAEKGTVHAKDRQGAIKGGGDSDDDDGDDDSDAPDAVAISQDKPKVAKAAAASSMRRRHA